MTHETDQHLLHHWYRHRSAEAFRVLTTRYGPMVYATALRLLHNPAHAEDIAQASFIELAYTRRPPNANPAAWLHKTAYRKAIDLIRSESRRRERNQQYTREHTSSDQQHHHDLLEHIDTIIATLPEQQRDPLVRCFFQQQTHAQIAKLTGTSRQTITHRINRGIQTVREELKSRGITAPAGAGLITLFQTNTSAAMPATLTKHLAALALTAKPAALATAIALATTPVVKTATVALLLVVAGVFAYTDFAPPSGSTPDTLQAALEPTEITSPPDIATITVPDLSEVPPSIPDTAASEPKIAEEVPESDDSKSIIVSGSVLLRDGHPFPNSNVLFVDADKFDPDSHSIPPYTVVNVDDSGNFTTDEIKAGTYSVKVNEPGIDHRYNYEELARVTLAPGDHLEDLELVFYQDGQFTVGGQVVDTGDNPIADVRVNTSRGLRRNATTDEQGRFTLYNIPKDVRIHINFDKRDRTRTYESALAGQMNLKVVMHAKGSIAGSVIDAMTGLPVPKFEVSFMNGHALRFRESLFGNGKTVEHEQGRYEFETVYVGDITVVARAEGFAPTLTHTTVKEYEISRVELVLERQARNRIEGIVLTKNGTPIKGAKIFTGEAPMEIEYSRLLVTETDAQGRYVIEDLPEDIQIISALHPDFAPGSCALHYSSTITLREPAILHVHFEKDGKPAPNTRLLVSTDPETRLGYIRGGQSGQSGVAKVENLVPGPALLRVMPTNEHEIFINTTLESGDNNHVYVELTDANAALEAHLHFDAPLGEYPHAILWVDTPSGEEMIQHTSFNDNVFSFPKVPEGFGNLVVMLGEPLRKETILNIPLESEKVTSVDVVPNARNTIIGQIESMPPDKVGGINIYFGPVSLAEAETIDEVFGNQRPEVAGFANADATGYFESTYLYPGTYTLVMKLWDPADFVNRQTIHLGTVEVTNGHPTEFHDTLAPE